MDVTAEILQNHITYGASDNTAPAGLSSSRSLNYASGPSLKRPDAIKIATIPYTLKFQDSVGLFGAENYFIKVTVAIDMDYVASCFEEPFWECAVMRDVDEPDTIYTQATIDRTKDLNIVNTFDPANIKVTVNNKTNPYVSIELKNLKTGNIYIDSWLDSRLYTANQEEHPYDKMYVRANDCFYLGVHARNTRRLPYNIECIIGNEYKGYSELTDEDRRYIARRIS